MTDPLINELLDIEASARLVVERCCKARKQLEGIYSPAPKRGRPKKRGMNEAERAQMAKIISRRRKQRGNGNKKPRP